MIKSPNNVKNSFEVIFLNKRLCTVFFLLTFIFSCLTGKIASIINNDSYKSTALKQWSNIINVTETRGTIYDKNFKPLVNEKYKTSAAVNPNNYSSDALFKNLPPESRPEIAEKLSSHLPFVIDVPCKDIYSYGIDIFEVPVRYSDEQPAVHIIGSLDSDGNGNSGIEKYYDNLLKSKSGNLNLTYPSNAFNEALQIPAKITDTTDRSKGGIVTTLDKDLQNIIEKAGKSIEKGAIVIQDPLNGDILASASFPSYDPNNMEKSLENPLAPFVNRAFCPFAVGSTFKLLTAATALEEGIGSDFAYNCRGYIEIGRNIFRCHNLSGHGNINMAEAVKRSCNPYFINLSQQINGQSLLYKAKLLGFGERAELAPGYFTESGSLPTEKEIMSPAALANFSFGQGILTATPIQTASLISAFANRGKYFVPRLIEGSTDTGVSFCDHSARYREKDVILPSAAEKVAAMMVSVIEEGSGKKAKPRFLTAAGKTASAQSGQYDENGREIVHAWFSGFYPAESPKYTIVVLCEGAFSGGDAAAPVFKEICDEIYKLRGENYLLSPNENNVNCINTKK